MDGVEFQTRVNTRARRLILRVEDGKVIVTMPRPGMERAAENFVKKNTYWIRKQFNKEIREEENRFNFNLLEEIIFQGIKYPVEIISTKNKRLKLSFDSNRFNLYLNDEHSYEDIKNVLEKWYKLQAKQIIPNIIQELGYSDQVSRITIRGQKTCWGSCTSNSTLSFNWKLMMAPEHVAKYIIMHELTHLEHMNHSSRFWLAVKEKCPDYKLSEIWLKRNGNLLKF